VDNSAIMHISISELLSGSNYMITRMISTSTVTGRTYTEKPGEHPDHQRTRSHARTLPHDHKNIHLYYWYGRRPLDLISQLDRGN
jgi:hypothetical protein